MNNVKKNLLFLILAGVNFFSCFFLCIYSLPDQIPTLIYPNETIANLGTKWLMMLSAIIPSIFALIALSIDKKPQLTMFFKCLFYLGLYENMLLFTYFSLSNEIEIGKLIEIPLTAFVFLPFSVFILLYGLKIKHLEYKSPFGIKLKSTLSTEFIWKQSHLFASNAIAGLGLILFVFSVILSFFHYWFVTAIIFVIGIIITFAIIFVNSGSMFKKYSEMKTRQEKLNKAKENKE